MNTRNKWITAALVHQFDQLTKIEVSGGWWVYDAGSEIPMVISPYLGIPNNFTHKWER